MSAIPKFIKLRDIKDLVNIVVTTQIPLIHHARIRGRHVYFVPFLPVGDSSIIYYVEREEPIKGSYLIYNNFDGSITYSDRILNDAKLSFIPVIEVEEQNILPEKIFKPLKKK